ncbi:hypothetical protein PCE31106_04647 [Pandoraea cepalis]|uniref:Uncharacterized protein n=1 Tax=Pandoraea cepalis TaxID=2508294 RepID=A0A5E4YPL4_9BURK|nr:hypothetical protein [Pandoraea cepalis]VVE50746.1 hypothetical protein PCE31106_04647 [Pandoraea cepalis]
MPGNDQAPEVNWKHLQEFAQARSPESRQIALTALISGKFLPKFADAPEILEGKRLTLIDAVSQETPRLRLLAIAEIMRLGQVVKRWQPEIMAALEPAFVSELPPMSLLDEADDRLNLARALSHFQREWLVDYLATSIVEEEQGEKARAELMAALLVRSETLAAAIAKLAARFKTLRPSTDSPANTVARRLTRTLSALRACLPELDIEAGTEIGVALNAVVEDAFSASGRPDDEKAKIELVRETLLVLHDIVRTRFSVVADATTYRVVTLAKRFWRSSSWPDDLAGALGKLITDVSEALILLGRQGRRDQSLLDQLDILCKYPERARAISRSLAARHIELDESVRKWLSRERDTDSTLSSYAAEEIVASNANASASIGLALQTVREARAMAAGLREPLLSGLEIYEPNLTGATRALLDTVNASAVEIEQVARLRGISLYGNRGEEIDVAPKFFEIVGATPRSRMTVKQPAIVRIRENGDIREVILKGLVE